MTESAREKVVVNKAEGVVKGFWPTDSYRNAEQVVLRPDVGLPESLVLRQPSGEALNVALHGAKAVFFVREFDGQRDRKDIRFHQHSPTNNAVWVRVEFHDGEELEGFIHNSVSHLSDDGFFLLPSDPGSNNRLVYVLKSALASFCVLGVRSL